MLTRDGILSNLKHKNVNISLFESVTSTNTILKEMAITGEPEGTIIIALSQTAGRGRYDRKFYSDKGGIYFSILFRPKHSAFDTTLLTSAAAVAVSNAIENLSKQTTQIKWVNDILINNKKVCGILCEGGFTGDNGFVIVGIGINAFPTENGFNDEIKNIATTIFETFEPQICEKLCALIIDNLFYQYQNLEKRDFLKPYREKNIVLGKEVAILKQGEGVGTGTVLAIDDNCHLIVKLPNGEITTLSSGEVSVKL